jgi:hypothetical protein
MVPRDVAQFLVDQGKERFQRILVARLPAHQQFAHRVGMLLIHSWLQSQKVDVKIASVSEQVNGGHSIQALSQDILRF